VSESFTPLDELMPESITSPWVLIFGGISRDGNRRARRSAREAVREGVNVLWLDGFEERYPGQNPVRVPIDDLEGTGSVTVAGYRFQERSTLLNRLSYGPPKENYSGPESDQDPFDATNSRLYQAFRSFRTRLFRKIGQAFRGYLIWRLLRPTILRLHESSPHPVAIVYCDDHTIPSGWHAARIWEEVPTGMEFRAS